MILKNTGNLCYQDIMNMGCECDGSPFKNSHFGHIITGDLNIIQNPTLREICSFGTKFRENPIFNIRNIQRQIKDEIDNITIKISQKLKIPRKIFKKWKFNLYQNMIAKLNACKDRISYKQPALANTDCKSELTRLQDSYVITVVDKAAGNFAFTCKKFYFMKLAQELGLDNPNPGNETYTYSGTSLQGISCDQFFL